MAFMTPSHRTFFVNDTRIAFPHGQERVPLSTWRAVHPRHAPLHGPLLQRQARGVAAAVRHRPRAHHLADRDHQGCRRPAPSSGHSSFSFACLGFLSLFLASQLRVFDSSARRSLVRALLCLMPLLGAALIAISRCEDYRHDGYDVSCGSALGMTVAYWSYRRYWPKLSSPDCHEPLPPPAGAAQQWHRVRDEEAGAERGGNVELQGIRAAPG